MMKHAQRLKVLFQTAISLIHQQLSRAWSYAHRSSALDSHWMMVSVVAPHTSAAGWSDGGRSVHGEHHGPSAELHHHQLHLTPCQLLSKHFQSFLAGPFRWKVANYPWGLVDGIGTWPGSSWILFAFGCQMSEVMMFLLTGNTSQSSQNSDSGRRKKTTSETLDSSDTLRELLATGPKNIIW